MISTKVKNLAAYFQKGGVYEVLQRLTAAELLPEWLLYFCEAQILRLDRLGPRAAARPIAGYEYEQVDQRAIDELLACSGTAGSPTRRKFFKESFDHGARCHVMKRDGRVAAFCWTFEKVYLLTFDNYRRKIILITLDKDSVFLGNVFVVEAHRRRGVFSHLINQVVSQWPESARLYSWVERTNDPSLQAHHRLGFVPLTYILCATICGITGYWIHTAPEKDWHRALQAELGSLHL